MTSWQALSDEELMTRYQTGHVPAFEELVRRHRRAVFHVALRSLGSAPMAEDALQEIFLRVVRNAQTWEPKAKFTTWLFTITRNHCIDASRKNKFRKTESLDAPLSDEEGAATRMDRVASQQPPTDENAAARGIRVAIDAALARLPEEQREVFVLREYGGVQFKDIAELTGVSENTVKSRMRYALESIRNHLTSLGVSPQGS